MFFDVEWVQTGVTRVEADSHEEARQALTDYPFGDDVEDLQIIAVESAG